MNCSMDDARINYKLMRKCLTNKPKRFFHYTSQASFYAMFKDYTEEIVKCEYGKKKKYVTLFASQVQFLNDRQEYIEGVKIVSNANIPTTDLFESIFVTCFCGKEDLLSQWKYYGKDCGISIEFDFSKDVRLCWFALMKKENVEETPFVYWTSIRPYSVIYKNHETEFDRIRNEVRNNKFKDLSDKEAANIFVPYCKNSKFSEENESRLVFYPIKSELPNGDCLLTQLEYRESKGKIIPQFKCKIAYENNNERIIPVKSVMIGPGYNQHLVFNSVINMLEPDREKVRFFSDEEIENAVKYGQESKRNNIGIKDGRVTYITSNHIKISMSTVPMRD